MKLTMFDEALLILIIYCSSQQLIQLTMQKEFVIEMTESYPFGQLAQTITQNIRPLVKKTLHYQNQEEYEMIKQMAYFLKAARHDHLVNVDRMLETQGYVELYYEYVPMRLQKWLLDINQQLVGVLEEQLIEVADYLTRCSLKFEFDPACVGLGKEMTVKYFLNQFTVDLQNQDSNLKVLQVQIRQFFRDLCGGNEYKKPIEDRQSMESYKSQRFESVSTNQSIQGGVGSQSMQLLKVRESCGGQTMKRKGVLSQKVEDSMKKSLQVLQKFKKMNQK